MAGSEVGTQGHRDSIDTRSRARRFFDSRYADWAIEPAMRYMPIVREIRRRGYDRAVTEVGSGRLGIAPYLKRPVDGVDTGFAQPLHPLIRPLVGSVLDLPFEAASLPCVVSTDMLEHVEAEVRSKAVIELLRVTRDLLVIAVPTGSDAERQDEQLARYYLERHGRQFPFLEEHVKNGLLSQEDLRRLIEDGLRANGREARVRLRSNGNLRLRSALMRLWIRSNHRLDRAIWRLLILAHPILSRANFGECYRTIAVVDLSL